MPSSTEQELALIIELLRWERPPQALRESRVQNARDDCAASEEGSSSTKAYQAVIAYMKVHPYRTITRTSARSIIPRLTFQRVSSLSHGREAEGSGARHV